MMKNIKLGHRLIGLFMVMAVIVAMTGGFGAIGIKRVGARTQDMLTNLSNQQKLVLLMEVAQKDCHIILLSASRIQTDFKKFVEYTEDFNAKRELFRRHCETILKGNPK